jgi:hypothetical protein
VLGHPVQILLGSFVRRWWHDHDGDKERLLSLGATLVEVTSGNGDFLAPDMKRSKGGGKVEV